VGALSLTEPHNEFLELCAVSTSGQLTEEEQKRLQEHLVVCASCREILQQYETVISQAIPSIAANESSEELEPGPGWSGEQAEKVFLKRLAQQETPEPDKFKRPNDISTTPHRLPPFPSESTWRHVWMLYAAGILLFVSLSFYAYRAGIHRGTDIAKVTPPAQPSTQIQPSLEAQLSDAGHERQVARAQAEQRDKTIVELRQRLAQQSDVITQMKAAQDHLEKDLRASDAGKQDVVQQRTELAQKLDAAQSSSQTMQQKLDSLSQQSAQDATRAKILDAKVNDLTRTLHEREVALEQKDELLAHDRDIRELMGARDLYIAEVHDVARDGLTQIPYGRVFYTKGKSLIFYAYDLDRQTELRRAGTFQAWGRRGPDREQALNLGVFYEDSGSNKRWILKCDDPKTLAQIDAVFVTVEPNGGSHKPSGKSLLFAYLRVDPNHP
jgi:hypothetical protein